MTVSDRRLDLRYALDGDVAHLRLPTARQPRHVDGLWQHTCFEAFVGAAGALAYHELNFAPSGEWAAYSFRRYRERAEAPAGTQPEAVAVYVGETRVELEARVPLAGLPGLLPLELRLGLAAVIEDERGALSYWALAHPAGRPDFHHPDAFTMHLPSLLLLENEPQ